MIYIIFNAIGITVFTISLLKKWPTHIKIAFFIMLLGTHFVQSPFSFLSPENQRIETFIAMFMFVLGSAIIYLKEPSQKIKTLAVIQLILLSIIFITWYFKLPGSHPVALVDVLISILISFKIRRSSAPFKLAFVFVSLIVAFEFIIRAHVFINALN